MINKMKKLSLLVAVITLPLIIMATEPEKKQEKENSKTEKVDKKGCSSSEKEQSKGCCAGKKPA